MRGRLGAPPSLTYRCLLRSCAGQIDELPVFDLQNHSTLDWVTGALELHVPCNALEQGNGSQGIAYFLAVQRTRSLDRLEQQPKGIVGQGGDIIGRLAIRGLIGLDESL